MLIRKRAWGLHEVDVAPSFIWSERGKVISRRGPEGCCIFVGVLIYGVTAGTRITIIRISINCS